MFSLLRLTAILLKMLTLSLKQANSMILKRILPTVLLTTILLLTGEVSAQVPVEISTEKVTTGGVVYYMHEVQKNQTLYSISKAYRVTIGAITGANVIPPNGIQAGQILRIPESGQTAGAGTEHVVTASQRTVAQPASRPAATTDGATGVRISDQKIVSGGKSYYMHEVKRGETLYSIARAYRVTILDIDRENAIPSGGIQAGQVLKIPVSSSLTVIEERDEANRDEPAAAGVAAAKRDAAPAGMPRQELPAVKEEQQMPRQELPAVKEEERVAAAKETLQQDATPVQAAKPTPAEQTAKPTPVQPDRKKIHRVQRGESLSSIAKKYEITVQELKKANRGVIFAMPDMRLVIPATEGQKE